MHAAFIFCPVLQQQDLHEKGHSRKSLVRGFQVLDMKEEPEQVEGYDFLD